MIFDPVQITGDPLRSASCVTENTLSVSWIVSYRMRRVRYARIIKRGKIKNI